MAWNYDNDEHEAITYSPDIWTVEGGLDNSHNPYTLLITMHASEEINDTVHIERYKYHVIEAHDLSDDHLEEIVINQIRIRLNHPENLEFN